ncbi:MAG TPA: hypothetical protein VJM11_10820 [Nevskiaceae bacterium]|nr:hypothetical protein [Nevskiaceae bacterium]
MPPTASRFHHAVAAALLLPAAALAGPPMDHAAHAPQDHQDHQDPATATPGLLGAYAMAREASGTSWQPEAAGMTGRHLAAGDWKVMLHGHADVVADTQGGDRGEDKVFVASMLMAMAQRSLGAATWGLRGMVSLDPVMGKRGYPLLFQTGETADGVTPLVDRQHPHDAFMELATTLSVPVGGGSVFAYVGLPGEPALGPAAFMHRPSGLPLPEAPLSHHWLDSTHVTFGVVTLGATAGPFKLEGSVFNGREPDENRWNIETRKLDAYSGRLTWNPSREWSVQASHGYLPSSELLEPEVALHRTTASASHTHPTPGGGDWSTTFAVGINREEGHDHPGWLLESARRFAGPWTAFGRVEAVENEHLVEEGPLAGETFTLGKLSLGGSRHLGTAGPLAFDVGALVSFYRVPGRLEDAYGETPVSGMLFLRTRLE